MSVAREGGEGGDGGDGGEGEGKGGEGERESRCILVLGERQKWKPYWVVVWFSLYINVLLILPTSVAREEERGEGEREKSLRSYTTQERDG